MCPAALLVLLSTVNTQSLTVHAAATMAGQAWARAEPH